VTWIEALSESRQWRDGYVPGFERFVGGRGKPEFRDEPPQDALSDFSDEGRQTIAALRRFVARGKEIEP